MKQRIIAIGVSVFAFFWVGARIAPTTASIPQAPPCATTQKLVWDSATANWVCSDATIYLAQIYKTADESVTSSTTLQDDDDFTATLGANTKYRFYMFAIINEGAGVGGYKSDWGGTVGIDTMTASHVVLDGTTNLIGDIKTITGLGDPVTAALSSGTSQEISEGTLTTTTAGTFKFVWAQNASSASATTIKKGSYFYVIRM